MATEDYPLLDSPSHHPHAQPHLHATTRHHFHSYSSSTPPALPVADSATPDFYPHSSFSDADDSSGHSKSGSAVHTPNSKRSSAAGSPFSHNKKLKSSAVGSDDPDAGNDATFRGGDYRKDREEWSDTAIACLLDAYTEKFNQLNRGNLRGRDWEEVAEAVGERCGVGSGGGDGKHKSYKSVEQCKNKIDNLKKRYKVELQRIGSGGASTSHWHWFKKIEAIVGNSLTAKTVSDDENGGGAMSSSMARQAKNRYHTR